MTQYTTWKLWFLIKCLKKRLPCKLAGIEELLERSVAAHEPVHKQVYTSVAVLEHVHKQVYSSVTVLKLVY